MPGSWTNIRIMDKTVPYSDHHLNYGLDITGHLNDGQLQCSDYFEAFEYKSVQVFRSHFIVFFSKYVSGIFGRSSVKHHRNRSEKFFLSIRRSLRSCHHVRSGTYRGNPKG